MAGNSSKGGERQQQQHHQPGAATMVPGSNNKDAKLAVSSNYAEAAAPRKQRSDTDLHARNKSSAVVPPHKGNSTTTVYVDLRRKKEVCWTSDQNKVTVCVDSVAVNAAGQVTHKRDSGINLRQTGSYDPHLALEAPNLALYQTIDDFDQILQAQCCCPFDSPADTPSAESLQHDDVNRAASQEQIQVIFAPHQSPRRGGTPNRMWEVKNVDSVDSLMGQIADISTDSRDFIGAMELTSSLMSELETPSSRHSQTKVQEKSHMSQEGEKEQSVDKDGGSNLGMMMAGDAMTNKWTEWQAQVQQYNDFWPADSKEDKVPNLAPTMNMSGAASAPHIMSDYPQPPFVEVPHTYSGPLPVSPPRMHQQQTLHPGFINHAGDMSSQMYGTSPGSDMGYLSGSRTTAEDLLAHELQCREREVQDLQRSRQLLQAHVSNLETKVENAEVRTKTLQDKLDTQEVTNNSEKEKEVAALQTRLDEAQEQLERLRVENQGLQTALRSSEGLQGELQNTKLHTEELEQHYHNSLRQLEEKTHTVEDLQAEFVRAQSQVGTEVELFKQQLQERMRELEPLPEMLQASESRLQEVLIDRVALERHRDQMQQNVAVLTRKVEQLLQQLDRQQVSTRSAEDAKLNADSKLGAYKTRCEELELMNKTLRDEVLNKSQLVQQLTRRVEDKIRENASLSHKLESVAESGRVELERIRERYEAQGKNLQARIRSLEDRIQQANIETSRIASAKDEMEQKLQGRIADMSTSLEQVRSSNQNLQTYINYLRSSYKTLFTPEGLCPFCQQPNCRIDHLASAT